MMANPNIPTISITKQNDSYEINSDENDYDCNLIDSHTDVEDLESNDEKILFTKTLSPKNLGEKSNRSSPALTDIEDFHDSDSEPENNKVSEIPEVKISLEQFLETGVIKEKLQTSNILTSTNKFEGSDEKNLANFAYIGHTLNEIIMKQNFQKAKNENEKITKTENEESKERAEEEKEGACCLTNTISEFENMTASEEDSEGYEEENKNPKNFPVIDITFVPDHNKTKKQRKLSNHSSRSCSPYHLDVSENLEDPLTDIEKWESESSSSENTDVSSDDPIPRAHITRASFSSITDIEDMDISNAADLVCGINQEEISELPPPVRQLMIVKESKCGDPITKIMPLAENIENSNFDSYYNENYLTDVEDISDIEDDSYIRLINAPTITIPIIENAVVQNSENFKVTTHHRKNEFSDKEPVTETEEIFVAGTARRKKSNKHKVQSNKQKSKFLEIISNNEVNNVTDVEEIEVSDFESRTMDKKCSSDCNDNKEGITKDSRISSPEQTTDLEYVTGDDTDFILSDTDPPKSTCFISNQLNFYSSVSTSEGLLQEGDKIDRKPSPVARGKIFESESSSRCPTDIEDVQLTSDVEENPLNESYSKTEIISPIDIQDVLNDSVSVVYEKCGNVFNVDKEKNFIKGMKDCLETNTDIEYLDEEIAIGGVENAIEKCNNNDDDIINQSEGEEAPTKPKPDDGKK